MHARRQLLLGLAAAVTAALPGARALAQVASAATGTAPVSAAGTDADDDAGPRYATPTTVDRAGRVLAPVRIGAEGPLRFVVDTGANRSAIAERTAARLGVTASGEALVHGITGSAVMPQVEVPEFAVGELLFERYKLAILPDAVFGSADGIIGIDALQKARLDINFRRGLVTVRNSPRRPPTDRLTVRATLKHRGLLVVPGRIARIPVKAIIDTGAERSLGNVRLFDRLMDRVRNPQLTGISNVVGATAQVEQGQTMIVPIVDLGGGAMIGNLPVTFGNFHVFKVWELLDEPALVVGMDVLGTLPEFSIDYPRREFQPKVEHRLPPIQLHSDF